VANSSSENPGMREPEETIAGMQPFLRKSTNTKHHITMTAEKQLNWKGGPSGGVLHGGGAGRDCKETPVLQKEKGDRGNRG